MTSTREWHNSRFHSGSKILLEHRETETADGMTRQEYSLSAVIYPFADAWDAAIRQPGQPDNLLLTGYPTAAAAFAAVEQFFDEIDRLKA